MSMPLLTDAYYLNQPIEEHKARSFNLKGAPITASAWLVLLLVGCQFSPASSAVPSL
jgi:hypothetical protein